VREVSHQSGTALGGIRTIDDIKDRCKVDDITGCWIWAGAMKNTAPRVWLPGIGAASMPMALQVVLHGTKPTAKRMLIPTCGRVDCANPAHRKWGSKAQMFRGLMAEMAPEHRARMTLGKRSASKVCTPQIAADVCASTEPAQQIADRLGVHVTHVYRIKRGDAWQPQLAASSVFTWGLQA
jgi:hypothetical protein